ncbi:vgr related protein [Allosphingosinicella flava]|uniref:Vgr related protein n=1 Tax=Allosphingosinicella flava TaxID=2771430 RepID=A0A7T2GK60_9SPHN|nr:vgr related protein [Sphingosinicella flava]QPQ55277.1 vgr related protein [Sphingosinicella flava]
MTTRPLTPGEIALACSIFGDAIDYRRVTIRRRKWFPFQPRETVMAPCGHIHFHPDSSLWREDYSVASLAGQGLFIHEMTHVWQTQRRGRYYLPLMRHPFCRYRYRYRPGWPLQRYGLEQQAEIVRHVFLLRRGAAVAGALPIDALESILPF